MWPPRRGVLHLTARRAWDTLGSSHASSQSSKAWILTLASWIKLFSRYPVARAGEGREVPCPQPHGLRTLQPLQVCCWWSKQFCKTTTQPAEILVSPKVRQEMHRVLFHLNRHQCPGSRNLLGSDATLLSMPLMVIHNPAHGPEELLVGLPWWLRDSVRLQCRRHGLDPWSGRIPHASDNWPHVPQLLSLCSRAGSHNKGNHCNEKPKHCN